VLYWIYGGKIVYFIAIFILQCLQEADLELLHEVQQDFKSLLKKKSFLCVGPEPSIIKSLEQALSSIHSDDDDDDDEAKAQMKRIKLLTQKERKGRFGSDSDGGSVDESSDDDSGSIL